MKWKVPSDEGSDSGDLAQIPGEILAGTGYGFPPADQTEDEYQTVEVGVPHWKRSVRITFMRKQSNSRKRLYWTWWPIHATWLD
jgi:hypothetical protein